MVNEERPAHVGQFQLQCVMIGAVEPGSLRSGIGSVSPDPDVTLSGDR